MSESGGNVSGGSVREVESVKVGSVRVGSESGRESVECDSRKGESESGE